MVLGLDCPCRRRHETGPPSHASYRNQNQINQTLSVKDRKEALETQKVSFVHVFFCGNSAQRRFSLDPRSNSCFMISDSSSLVF